MWTRSTLALAIMFAGAATLAAQSARFGVGRPPTPDEVRGLGAAIAPDGGGLPDGSGTVAEGRTVYAARCASCHGPSGEGGGAGAALVGGKGTLASARPLKTVGSFWPQATTVWDYVNRAMPFDQPGLLKPDDVYAVVAFILNLNGIIADDVVMNAATLPAVKMPNRDGFVADPRPDVRRTAALTLESASGAEQTGAPSVQYRSPEGVEYRSLPDTDAVKSARSALEADPRNIGRIIDLGVAQSGARQFREAIATFTRGLEIEPNNALLLRWRGHRYLSVREFDRAFADLTRGGAIDSTIYGIWYHLGIVQFVRGDFDAAAASFARAQPIAPDAGELAGSTDWLWMSLSRAGRGADAKAMLDRRPEKPVANAYTRRLQLYRGEIGPDAVITPADTDDVQVATLAYGLGNWYLVRGDKAQARTWFERSIRSGGWPGFGFIVSEVELRRLR